MQIVSDCTDHFGLPTSNPVQPLVDDISQWDSGVWVHYSDFPDLKVNPKQFHRDPAGIYLFPEGFETKGNWERKPYKFRVQLKRQLNILDLGNLSPQECFDILDKLIPSDHPRAVQWEPHKKAILSGGSNYKDQFWEIMKNYFINSSEGAGYLSGSAGPGAWNKALRGIGYDAVFDDTDSIHVDEVQLLVLDPTAVKIIERVDQKSTGYAEMMDLAKRLAEMLKLYGDVKLEEPRRRVSWGVKEFAAKVSVQNGDRGLHFEILPRFLDKETVPHSITVYLKYGARALRDQGTQAETFEWKDRPWTDLSDLEKLVKRAAAEEFKITESTEVSMILSESVDGFGIPLVEDFKTSAKRFQDQGATEEEVIDYFSIFKNLKARITNPDQKDIDKWKSWSEFKAFIDDLKSTKSKSQTKKLSKQEGATLVSENEGWRVYQITDYKASMLYGSNTQWCITSDVSPGHWQDYASKNNIYFLISKTERVDLYSKIAVLFDENGFNEARDEQDKFISGSELMRLQSDLKFPRIDSFAEAPEGIYMIVGGKQVSAKQAIEGLKKDQKALKELVSQSLGKKVASEKYYIEDNDLVLFEGEFVDDFVDKLTMIYGVRNLEHLPRMDDFQPVDWNWDGTGHQIEYMIDSLPEVDKKKVETALFDAAKKAGIIEDELNPEEYSLDASEYETLFSDNDVPMGIYDAVSYGISDGYQAAAEQNKMKAVIRALEAADFQAGENIIDSKKGLRLEIPLSVLLSRAATDEPDLSIDVSDNSIDWDYDYDDESAISSFKDNIHDFLKGGK